MDKLNELPKQFDPSSVESRWYAYWTENRYFHSEPDEREPYAVVIPPPNVTGVLHMGHMLNNTIQDVLVRRARMLGKNACWVPGTDHASIATEAKVVQRLRKKGIKKSDLSREDFLKHAWEWTEEHGGIILEQLKKLGASCDWDRTRFTLEDTLYEAVIDCFIDLHQRGLIYRGLRMINWDPEAKTALSDEEVIFKEQNSRFYYVRYQFTDSEDYLTIATTRPETILADTAVCVNPDDERYKAYIGRTVRVPIANREIPVIADEYVDIEFGTGCLKITPAHDRNDYELGQKHGLPVIDMLEADGTVSAAAGHYVGLDRFDARKQIARDLEEAGLLVKVEDMQNKVGYSERTDVVIEPRLSLQWFLNMKELAVPALENVENDTIQFHPPKFKNAYRNWMENIQDWCISRQLWWGHRIPAWYFGEGEHDYVIARSHGEALEKARAKTGNAALAADQLRQDEDVLDTWFSSWLWPITVFDGMKDPDNKDIRYYYPTQDLVTAPEIMFFWVARMIMAGYAFTGQKPFSNVYYHGIVRDKQRRKMSKSLGNSPDPLDLISTFGADGTRVGMLFSSPAGNDLLFDEALCEQGRNFANKIWNAFRFLTMNMEEGRTYIPRMPVDSDSLADRWMLSRLNTVTRSMDEDFERFRLNEALQKVYALVWDDFCDWYIELCKSDVPGQPVPADRLEAALGIFEELMKLLHPFMPFISEEIWHHIRERKVEQALLVTPWPKPDTGFIDAEAEQSFALIQQVVSALRNIRAEAGIAPGKPIEARIATHSPQLSELVEKEQWILSKLQKLSSLTIAPDVEKPGLSASAVVGGMELFVPMEGLIDLDKERQRILREIERFEGFRKGVEAKLNNQNFVARAPGDVVQNEKNKLRDATANLDKLREQLAALG
ncbi:MAG: valyl-tRNA synthetase ValS [Bacteroidetes bacterium HLUCCA01]|nr:MAG: valyl-tRNA synthetase ValS [Bacteroidetes bacterium HLUCCA01]